MVYNPVMANLIVKGIPDDLYRKFKADCVMQGISIKDKLIDMIRNEVKKEEKQS